MVVATLIVLAGLLLAACGSEGTSVPEDDPDAQEQLGEQLSEDDPDAQEQLGEQLFTSSGCAGCHVLAAAGSTGTIGPDLDEVLPGSAAQAILRSIIDPSAELTPGFDDGVMPQDYGDQLSQMELDALVAFLLRNTDPSG
jgi:mono/diheme cytochrome c family protein